MKSPRRNRRDLLLILLLVPFGMLCMFITGQMAIQLKPLWQLEADLRSFLNPTANFLVNDEGRYEPIEPNIPPPQRDLGNLLDPNSIVPTNAFIVISTPIRKDTPAPTAGIITPVLTPPPTSTISGPIIVPTSQGPSLADLTITKTDSSNTYTPGTPIQYTIVVTNRGPDRAPTFNVTDNVPAVITGLKVNCTPAVRCGTNTSNGNNISFTGASLFNQQGGEYQITITISGTVVSGASGNLSNTASVVVPNGSRYRDPNTTNNSITDTDTQLSVHDLAITKTDGSNTYSATVPIIYTIVVTNNGPSDALGVRVVDNLPIDTINSPQFTSWTWTCTMTNATGCTGVSASTTNFTDNGLNIQVGGRIEYTVTANPAGGIVQSLSNTVKVTLPVGSTAIDPNLSNNTATDTDIPYIDLQITKDDGSATFAANSTVTYTVTVTNNSTFDVTGIAVSDPKPGRVATWSWDCAGGCTPVTNSNANFIDTIDLTAGNSLTYTVTANISGNANPGNLTNRATISVPAGLVEAVPADNVAIDVDAPYIDLQITKDDGVVTYTPGGVVTYTVAVTNNSTFNLPGIGISDPKPVQVATWTWNCASGCTSVINSSTNFTDTINLNAGGSLVYTVTANISGTAVGNMTNTAMVSAPTGFVDVLLGNNSATDIDTTNNPGPNIGPPDGILFDLGDGSSISIVLGTPITSNGDPTVPDLVYYGWNSGGVGLMDWVLVEISADNSTWYPVFYWGNCTPPDPPGPQGTCIADTNANVNINVIGGYEVDNRALNPSILYNNSGVTIDIDSLGLSGSYPYIRITAPIIGGSTGNGDGLTLDSIQPYYP